jgi:hypothetical protein
VTATAARPLPLREALPATPRRDERDGGAWPHTTRLLPWTLAGFLAMVWLIPFDAVTLPIPMPLDARLDRPVLLVVIGVWLLAAGSGIPALRPRVRITRIHATVAVFIGIAILSLILNAHVLVDLDEFQLVLKKLFLLISFVLFFVVVASTVRPAEVSPFISYMLGLAALTAIGTVYEYHTKHDFFFDMVKHIPGATVQVPADLDQPDSIGRITIYSSTGHPLEVATLLGMATPFGIVRLVESATWRRRIGYGLLCGLLIGGALSTYRKTSVVAPVAGLLVLIAYRPRVMLRTMAPFAVVLFLMVHALAPGATGAVFSQLSPSRQQHTLSTTDRASDYAATWPDISKHLLVGRGYESYDPHKYRILDNEYLGLLITTGFLGLIAWLLVVVATMSLAHGAIRSRHPIRSSPALAATASVAVLGVAMALFDALGFPHVPYLFFFIAGLITVLARTPDPGRTTR